MASLIHHSVHLACVTCLVALLSACLAVRLPDFTGDRNNFTIYNNAGKLCLQASFQLNFYIYYKSSIKGKEEFPTANIELPKNVTSVGGVCNATSGFSFINITWFDETHFTTELVFRNFSGNKTNWTLYQIIFSFNSSNMNYFGPLKGGLGDLDRITYYSEEARWFYRTVQSDQYFYCHGCKKIKFSKESGACHRNRSYCSYVTLQNAAIFLGDFQAQMPSRQICYEDWVAERDVLVPIAVGGFLGLLLVAVLIAYVIAFIRRHVKDKHSARYRKIT